MLKRLITSLLLVFPLIAFSQNTQVKLGYVDIQEMFLVMPEVKMIDSTLKTLTQQHENEAKRMEQEFQSKMADYQQNQAKWDDAIKKNREDELQTMQTKIQNYYQAAQQSLQQKQEELQKPLQDKMLKAINEVGKENGFLYIFHGDVLLYKSDQAIDIAPLLKKKLNIK